MLPSGRHQSNSRHVTHCKDGSRLDSPTPQLLERRLAGFKSHALGDDTRGGAPGRTDRLPVACQPARADPGLTTVPWLPETDDRYPPVAQS